MTTSQKMKTRISAHGIPVNDETAEQLSIYFALLTEWNQKMDLTAVMDDDEMTDRHFIDSLMVLRTGWIPERGSLIDVGTGAGFPGMVLAIAGKGLQVSLLDAQQKRLTFLETVCRETGIGNVQLIHSRAEDAARMPEMREAFDVVCARAVAPLNVLAEYLLPFVKINGKALCWKGPGLKEEIETGKKAVFLLGGKIGEPCEYSILGREWNHVILPIFKVQNTSRQYPRRAGLPKSCPLGERRP